MVLIALMWHARTPDDCALLLLPNHPPQFQYVQIWGFLFQSGFYMYLMLTCFGVTVLVGGMKEIRRLIKAWMKRREAKLKALMVDY